MTPYRNLFLQQLAPATLERLHLRLREFPVGEQLEQAETEPGGLYFLEEGFCSATIATNRRPEIEVAVTGIESAVGLQALWGGRRRVTRTVMRSEGYGYFCSIEDARREAERKDEFQALSMRHLSLQLNEALTSTACNAAHRHAQRMARWLLTCASKAGRNTLTLSQQLIADMIGVTRPTVSELASSMKRQGIIAYSRGTLSILDQDRLRAGACECYAPLPSYLPENPYVYLHDGV
jgi:CRP-like cAMP-binding protein